jgi:hypothetical protein
LNPFVAAARIASIAIATLVLTLACDREPPSPITDEPPTVPADDLPSSVVPAKTVPASGRTVPDMTSYEVAIAIAAANRKKAESDCDTRPTQEREACMTEVETDWSTTRSALEDLRGEQQ